MKSLYSLLPYGLTTSKKKEELVVPSSHLFIALLPFQEGLANEKAKGMKGWHSKKIPSLEKSVGYRGMQG